MIVSDLLLAVELSDTDKDEENAYLLSVKSLSSCYIKLVKCAEALMLHF